MKTGKLTGYFDTRVYNAKVEKKDRKFIAEGERITFGASFDADKVPDLLKKYSKPYTTKNGEARAQVTFKIGGKVRWINERGQFVNKPTNPELDGKRFEVFIDYKQLDGDPNNKEACGYWVNQIMFREKPENALLGCRFEDADTVAQPETDSSDTPDVF